MISETPAASARRPSRSGLRAAGTLRAEAGRNPYHKALPDLIGELSTRGDTFRQRWTRHEVRPVPHRVHHCARQTQTPKHSAC